MELHSSIWAAWRKSRLTWKSRNEKPLPTPRWLPAEGWPRKGAAVTQPWVRRRRTRSRGAVRCTAVVLATCCCREQCRASGQTAQCGPHAVHGRCHLQCPARRRIWKDLWLNTCHEDLCAYSLSGLSSRLFVLC